MKDLALEQYVSEMASFKRLTDQEMVELSHQMRNGDEEAFATMVNANLRLAFVVARDYVRDGLSFLECISYANEGLMNAVKKWNPQTSTNFGSYAYKCIRSKLRDCTRTERLVPISDYAWKKITRLIRVQDLLFGELDHQPTCDDISSYINGEMSPLEIRDLLVSRKGAIEFDSVFEETYTNDDYLEA